MPLTVRPAQISDAEPMAELINKLIARGGTTAYRRPFDGDGIVKYFIEPRFGISCAVAVDGVNIVGFQALEWSDPDAPGPDKLPSDWAVIATYVALGHQGGGIGRKLLAATLAAARAAAVSCIDATIRHENTGGLAYYERMGFVDYRMGDDAVSKRLNVEY
jgi:ribosomal protein S18 acetylase RimI-like enzyme